MGRTIKQLRKAKGLTLEKLAKLTDSSKSYIWSLENANPPRPSAGKLARVALALGVTVDHLIDVNGNSDLTESVDQLFCKEYLKMDNETRTKVRKVAYIIAGKN